MTSARSVEVRRIRSDEQAAWLELRLLLWPGLRRADLRREQREILADRANAVFVAPAADRRLVGFVEVSIKDHAEGCTTRPVGYLEAWHVRPHARRRGIGRALLMAAEAWAARAGCREMASDTEFANRRSRRAHGALGLVETARIVLFAKKLGRAARSRRRPRTGR